MAKKRQSLSYEKEQQVAQQTVPGLGLYKYCCLLGF